MKKLKYFCEFCGTEVRQRDKICPKCGRFFSAVKCPRCGHSGSSKEFDSGCPVCGYSARAFVPPDQPGDPPPPRAPAHGKLPTWVYLVSAGILAVVVILCLELFRR